MPEAFRPEAPLPPYFDAARQAWILSRYADVSAALRTSELLQAFPSNEAIPGDPAERHATMLAAVQQDLAKMTTDIWRAQMESTLHDLLAVHRGSAVDLVRDILQPWSTSLLLQLIDARGKQSDKISSLSTRMFFATAAATANPPRNIIARIHRKFSRLKRNRDTAVLDQLSQEGIVNISTFAGLTQTLPSFLAKAWLALLHSPEQAAQLAAHPEAISGATEELLRYAGTVHTLYRKAASDTLLSNIKILAGQQVLLRLDSANFDPDRFDRPSELDLLRKPIGNLGLGTGLHACVGAVMVRLATAVATPVFLAANPVLDRRSEVRWTTDNMLLWPSSIPVRLPTQP